VGKEMDVTLTFYHRKTEDATALIYIMEDREIHIPFIQKFMGEFHFNCILFMNDSQVFHPYHDHPFNKKK